MDGILLLLTLGIQPSFSGDPVGGANTHLSSVSTTGDALLHLATRYKLHSRYFVLKRVNFDKRRRQQFFAVNLQVNEHLLSLYMLLLMQGSS